MAPPVRRRDRALIDRLRSEPHRFALLQAVRLAELNRPRAIPLGQGFDPRQEAVRLRGTLSQAFPASDVEAWRDGKGAAPPELVSAFLSLGGAFGPMPPPYSELGLERQRRGDPGIRDFLDVFNHRLLSLFVRTKRAHRPALQPGRPEDTGFATLLWALLGLGTPGLRHARSSQRTPRLPGLDHILLACAGLLNQRPVSAHAIERTLSYALATPVKLIPFAGRWLRLDENQTTVLGPLGRNTVLGGDAVVGRRVWDQSAAIRLELGPMTLRQMLPLLPGSKRHALLREILDFTLGGQIESEIKMILPHKQVTASRLSAKTPARLPRLGWTSWLTTRPRKEEGEVMLRLGQPGE
jgi:type VI secretion protein, VC_A0111 family